MAQSIWNRLFHRRNSLENPRVPLTGANIFAGDEGGFGRASEVAKKVTVDSALQLPAVWGAVNFLSRTLASLPLCVFRMVGEGRAEVTDRPVARIVKFAVSPEMTSFQFRKYMWERVFTYGRAYALIQRNRAGMVNGLLPIDPRRVCIMKSGQRVFYRVEPLHDSIGPDIESSKDYPAKDIIDLVYTSCSDGYGHYSPVFVAREIIGQALSALKATSRFYSHGGIPDFLLEGPFESQQEMMRASEDLSSATLRAMKRGHLAMALPLGHKFHQVAASPREQQAVQVQQYAVEQIARVFGIPPTMLQDLSKGTYANTEQGDLNFAKHTIQPLCVQFEAELNLKLFGSNPNMMFVEHSLEGILKGDIVSHTTSMSTAIASGQLTPNEARAQANRDPLEGGDELFMQSGVQPISKLLEEDSESDILEAPTPIQENEDEGEGDETEEGTGDPLESH